MTATTSPSPPRAATTASTALAELHKLVTVRSTWWFAGGAAAIMLTVALIESGAGVPADAVAVPVTVQTLLYFVQYLLGTLGIVAVTGEFASRSITVTFACTPSRTRVILAKAGVVGAAVFIIGTSIAALGVIVITARLGDLGALGADEMSDVTAMGVYLALLAMLGLGLGTLVRRTAGALSILVVLLLMVPELLGLAARKFDAPWLATVADYTPAPAGWQVMSGRWEFALVLLAWAGAALATGAWMLRVRDV